jgi:hypothetical protein
MKSSKQRRVEIKARRLQRGAAVARLRGGQDSKEILGATAPCDPTHLAPSNSYGMPAFVERGYYMDVLFRCASCLQQQVWSASRQKWWYEVMKGSVESRATRCNPCRRAERERKAAARKVHLEGVAARRAARDHPPGTT